MWGCEGGGGEKTKYLFACVGNTAQQHKHDAFFYAQPYVIFCAAEKTSSTATSALRLDNNAICECSWIHASASKEEVLLPEFAPSGPPLTWCVQDGRDTIDNL